MNFSFLKQLSPRVWFLYGAICIVLALMGSRMWEMHETYSILKRPLAENYSGAKDSEKVVVQFLDYRCVFCRKVHPVVEEFSVRNPDVKIVYRYVLAFGKTSLLEANMALAASMQGQDEFIKMHNYLSSRPTPVGTKVEAAQVARILGLDEDKFQEALYGPDTGAYHIESSALAETIKVNSTPTFLINKTIFQPDGYMPTVEDLEKIVNQVYGDG
jgi:protein-disulfide isomerase